MLELPKRSWTLLHAVSEQAKRYGERLFCTFHNGEELTFAGFESESSALAAGLSMAGVGPGDRVMVLGLNSKAFLLSWIATLKRGAIFVPLNTELKGAFLEHQVRNCEPKVVLVDAVLRGSFDSVSTEGVPIETTVVLNGDAPALPGTTHFTFADLLGSPARPEDVFAAAPHDICTIMYTSGTTGPSKGVLMSHGHCYLFGTQMARSFEMSERNFSIIRGGPWALTGFERRLR